MAKYMCFGGQRNRSHLKYFNDPVLSQIIAPDFIWDFRVYEDIAEFANAIKKYREKNPQIKIGSYHTACTAATPRYDTYPSGKMLTKLCKDSWYLRDKDGNKVVWSDQYPETFFLDIRREEVRAEIINSAIIRAEFWKADAICYDNGYWGITPKAIFPATQQEWTTACINLYKETRKLIDYSMQVIANVACTADKIPEMYYGLAPYLDGLMTEMAFHPNVRYTLAQELSAYDWMCGRGKMVLLIPRYAKDEDFALEQIRPIAKKYSSVMGGGKIYCTSAGAFHYNPLYRLE